jgi:SAM-dependent methyltransferase
MTFSEEWNNTYKNHGHLSIWPWSDLVSYVMRYARPFNEKYRVLEIGCGAGANIPFFEALGVQYYGIEGSEAIVESLKKRFPALEKQIVVGDFTKDLFFEGKFDLILDRAALTHNDTKSIKNSLSLIYDKLETGGKFMGIDWFSTAHSDFGMGDEIDQYTKSGFQEGQFIGIGPVHFSDREHLKALFSRFTFVLLEHKTVKKEIPEESQIFASWNLYVCKE